MIIDESLIENGIEVSLLAELIQMHESRNDRYCLLERYYRGEHDILKRERTSDSANNKIVCNHAKYITDMVTSYVAGNSVTYSTTDEYDISAIRRAYDEQDIASIDNEVVKSASIFGRIYELVYADEGSKPRSMLVDPRNAFVVYGNTAKNIPLFGVYYYKRYDLQGSCIGVVCNVYTKDTISGYANNTDAWVGMELQERASHYFGKVPLLEYVNNNECQGDFEQLISLIDAYNVLQSDRVNDKEQFVDAFLFLTGIEIDSEQAKKLKQERILLGYEGAKAEYLSKVMKEADIEVLRDCIKNDIHRLSMVPDMSDDEFGSNLSGVAIKYKLMGFEQLAKMKERSIAKTLRSRLELYGNFLSIKGVMSVVPVYEIDIVFARNLPVNELEVSEMISNLTDIVSKETLLSQLSFVADPKEEVEAVKNEQKEKQLSRIKEIAEMASGGGY